MGNRPTLYVLSSLLFPLALAGFFVGFACPVWKVEGTINEGLWQTCKIVIENCSYLNFYDYDYVMGTRAVEIAAAGLFFLTTLYLIIENIVSDFQGRLLIARVGAGFLSILGGMAGLAGIITYAVKTNDSSSSIKYGWALAINAAGSGLAIVLGVGLCLSGAFFEKGKKEKKPYSQGSDNYELSSYNNPAMTFDDLTHQPPASAPGYAVYNGHVNYPGSRSSLAGGNPGYGPSMYHSSAISNGESMYHKAPQRHSYVDDGRLLPPGQVYDLSEGYRPSRSRSASPRPPDYITPIARPATAMSYPGYLEEPVGRTAFRGDDSGYLRNSRVAHPEARGMERAYSNDDYYRGVRY